MSSMLRPLHAEPDPVRGGRIRDDLGREVLLRGVNVNAYAEYWSGNDFPTTFPFPESDADRIVEFGWNTVRLLFTWSRVEPEPGRYDDAYIEELHEVVEMLAERGIYTILDSHQDAWGPTLAARPGEQCDDGSIPANGWDGAPGWATLVDDSVSRCAKDGVRELSPAVRAAVNAFFKNHDGPGGVGIRTRYADMWGHLAARFAREPAVAGYDLLNEPNAFTRSEFAGLGALYDECLQSIREAEAANGGHSHMVLFEPPALWSSVGHGPPPAWGHDDNVVYSPHIYQGAFDGATLTRSAFEVAATEAAEFGGAPVLSGEWGTAVDNHYGSQRTGPDGDGYFVRHQAWQDEFHVSATLWTWRESFGDPHKVKPGQDTADMIVAGPFEVDGSTNEVLGERADLVADLTRPFAHAAPGDIETTVYDPVSGAFEIHGSGATPGTDIVVFYPSTKHGDPAATASGLGPVEFRKTPGGNVHVIATATQTTWSLAVEAG